MGWKDRVILVLGVGSGLGTALVALLGESGASVVGVARGRKALEPLESAGKARRWAFLPVEADVRQQSGMDLVMRSAVDRFGHIDAVSLNVGHWFGAERLLHETPDGEWSAGLQDNLDPVLRVGRAVFPHFIERGTGTLVLVSAAERVRLLGSAAYAAAKGGILALTTKLATDYRAHGIRVNAVLPGNMEREVDPLRPPDAARGPGLTDHAASSSWEVARAIQYLLSEEAAWVTGSLLTVDGGFSTRGSEGRAP